MFICTIEIFNKFCYFCVFEVNLGFYLLQNVFSYFKNFYWVILVIKNMYVSVIQFYTTSSVYCIVSSPSQVKSPSITIYSHYTLFYLPLSPFPLAITVLLSVSMSFLFSFFPLYEFYFSLLQDLIR